MSGDIATLLARAAAASSVMHRAQQERDDAIRAAKEAGASYAVIARAVGLTRSGVQSVVRRG